MLKKVLALALAGAMVLGSMSLTAFGAAGDLEADTQIVISGLKKGDKVHLYKVVEWVGDKDGNVSGWMATSDFAAILNEDELAKTIDDSETGYHGLTSDLAGDLSRAAVHEIDGSPFTTDGDTFTHTIAAKDLGMYMALIEPADVDTVYNPIFVSADYFPGNNSHNVTEESSYYGKTAAKKSTITLNKIATSEDDYTPDNGATVAVGDILDFTVTTTIPGYGETFETPAFEIKDTMKDLEYQEGSIDIVDADGNSLKDQLKTLDEGATGYTASFKASYLKTLNIPKAITITYKAKVLASAEIANINTEKNTVELKYSHDPSQEGKPDGNPYKYKKDITNHYTFSIDAKNLFKGSKIVGESGSEFIKIAVDRDGKPINETRKTYSNITKEEYEASPLEGCVFELLDKNHESFKPEKTVTTDADGRLKFENLDAGQYYLVEKSAPAGYVRDTTEHSIVIDAHLEPETYTEYYDKDGKWYLQPGEGLTKFEYSADELKWYKITFDGREVVATHEFMHVSDDETIQWSESEAVELPSSIHNTKGVELPSTGGIGTTIFYAGGALLVLLAGILLVSKRRVA